MSKIDLLKKLNKSLSPDKVDFSSLDSELNALKKKLTETVNIQTVDDVGRKIKQFQKTIDFSSLEKEIEKIRTAFSERTKELEALINERVQEINKASDIRDASRISVLNGEITFLKENLGKITESQAKAVGGLMEKIVEIKSKGATSEDIKSLIKELGNYSTKEDGEGILKEAQEAIDKLRRELVERMSSREGGSPNQQINVNSSVMSTKYADINFVSDTAIRWVASNDSTNKRVNIQASLISGGAGGAGLDLEVNGTPNVDQTLLNLVEGTNMTITDNGDGSVTFDATGGAGSGIVRTTSIITSDTTGSGTAGVDRVYFAQEGLRFTLPTAVGNSNLYTIKNHSNSSVLVLAPEGVDDGPSALMPVNYESLSFISNGSIYGVV